MCVTLQMKLCVRVFDLWCQMSIAYQMLRNDYYKFQIHVVSGAHDGDDFTLFTHPHSN